MTEDEAKTKWCPKIEHRGWGKCIGSGCMAWRWINPDSEAPEGFCGLAGRP
jgi:hypothetical protein